MAGAADDFKYVEFCKGVNGLDKVVLREVRGSSAEVRSAFLPVLAFLLVVLAWIHLFGCCLWYAIYYLRSNLLVVVLERGRWICFLLVLVPFAGSDAALRQC